jgi:opacity protein-like surface antigen
MIAASRLARSNWICACFSIALLASAGVEAKAFEGSASEHTVSEVAVAKSDPSLDASRELSFELGVGLLFNSRRAVDGRSFEFEYPPVLSVGLGGELWALQLERVDVESSDGNASVAVSRRREAWLIRAKTWWGEWGTWQPLASLGWGFSREHVSTRLSGAGSDSTEIGTGVWTGYVAGAVGLRAELEVADSATRALAIEVLLRGESSPQYGVLGKNNPRWGAGLQVFYAFN